MRGYARRHAPSHFCSPLFSRILWSLFSNKRSKLSNPTALGLPMGKTCAAYWMPPMAVMAPTIIANGGSASNGMTVSVWKKSSRSNARVMKINASRFFLSFLFFLFLLRRVLCLWKKTKKKNGLKSHHTPSIVCNLRSSIRKKILEKEREREREKERKRRKEGKALKWGGAIHHHRWYHRTRKINKSTRKRYHSSSCCF